MVNYRIWMYQQLIRPLLFQCDPEWAHHQVSNLAQILPQVPGGLTLIRMASGTSPCSAPELSQQIFNHTFPNPVGLAAGFDKNVRLTRFMEALGFGYAEVGSITALPSPGNPRPRLFRLPEDNALINRMGLNNEGSEILARRLATLHTTWPVGVSIAKTHSKDILGERALEDFEQVFRRVYGYGSYLSINISCPNTSEGKTFEEPEALDDLLARLRAVESVCQSETSRSSVPWLLKISPDLTPEQVEVLYQVAVKHTISGWVVCNTTANRTGLRTLDSKLTQIGSGGLSGPPLHRASLHLLAQLYHLSQGRHLLIGVGGINSVESAWDKITHGASLIQLYTALIYKGPALIAEINQGLLRKLKQHGLSHLSQAVGLSFKS